MRRAALVAVCTMLLASALAACSGDDDSASPTTTDAESTTSSAKPATTSTTVWHMNEKLRNANFGLEVFGVEDPYQPEGQDVPPAAGARYVAVDMEVADLSSKPVVVASTLQFQIEDAQGNKYQPKGGGHGKGPIDGELQSDEKRRRAVVYEVPDNATGFTLLFT